LNIEHAYLHEHNQDAACDRAEFIGSNNPTDNQAALHKNNSINLLKRKNQLKEREVKEKLDGNAQRYQIKCNLVEDLGLSESNSNSESGSGS
jgi:hypothetical protein